MAVRCPSIQKDIASACKASQEASILRSMRDHDDQTRARAHILAGNWTQVLELGRAWSQAEPNEPIARLLLVTGLLLKGDYREAYVQHDRLFMLPDEEEGDMAAPQDVRMRLNLGSAYYEQGIFEAAIAQYREALKLNPGDAYIHYNLGLALADQGRFEPAIAAYKESARLNPNDPLVRYALGVVQETKGRVNEAIGEFEAAVQLAPTMAAAHAKLGWLYYTKNQVPQALEHFEKASRHHPDDAQTLHGLGLAKLAAGKKDEGILSLKQAYQKEEREDKKRLIRSVLVKVGALSH